MERFVEFKDDNGNEMFSFKSVDSYSICNNCGEMTEKEIGKGYDPEGSFKVVYCSNCKTQRSIYVNR